MAEGIHAGPTIGAVVLRALRRHPDRVAFSWDGGRWTHGETASYIGGFQAAFAARGLGRGDRVAFLAGNGAAAWTAAIAAQALGAAITWLHPLASVDDQLRQVEEVEAGAVVVDCPRHEERAAALAERLGGDTVLGLGGDIGVDLLAAAREGGSAVARDDAAVGDLTIINYTGGTTGRAKGVARRHPEFVSMFVTSILAGFELPDVPRYLCAGPMTHVAGTKIIPTLFRGGTVHFLNGAEPERLLDAIERERINFTLLVPTMLYDVLDHPGLDGADLESLQLLLYGASPMSPTRLAEGIERMGPIFSQLYGQTECYPISVLRRSDQLDYRSSCGVPVPSAAVTLRSEEGEVGRGEAGEVCVRAPQVMDGYWKQPELTAEATAGGWLRTGDIAVADERGFLEIVDRKKDMIISGGFNVYPKEVEDALTAHGDVSAAAVFGVPDDRWGESVSAAVVLRAGAEVDAGALVRHVKDRKGSLHAPKGLWIVDALPTTAVGKVDKRALRAELGGDVGPEDDGRGDG